MIPVPRGGRGVENIDHAHRLILPFPFLTALGIQTHAEKKISFFFSIRPGQVPRRQCQCRFGVESLESLREGTRRISVCFFFFILCTINYWISIRWVLSVFRHWDGIFASNICMYSTITGSWALSLEFQEKEDKRQKRCILVVVTFAGKQRRCRVLEWWNCDCFKKERKGGRKKRGGGRDDDKLAMAMSMATPVVLILCYSILQDRRWASERAGLSYRFYSDWSSTE